MADSVSPVSSPEVTPGYPTVYQLHQSHTARVFYSERGLGELVVVKQFLGEEDSVARVRFSLEAATLGSLEHPQIPELLENNTDHFSPHFVMAAVERARNLQTFFRHNSLPLPASRAIHSILDPIGYIHDKNIVHRDIKTANILGRYAAKPVLGDFGIAAGRNEEYREVFETSTELLPWEGYDELPKKFETFYNASTGLTDTVTSIGTPDYMSPEQAQVDDIDITSDIYSLGVTFYELLYGKLPFIASRNGHNGFQPSPPEVPEFEDREDKIVDKIVPPAFRDQAEVMTKHIEENIDFTIPENRDIPRPLIAVVERATQKRPDDRYQSAAEMQEDVERAIRRVGDSPAFLSL